MEKENKMYSYEILDKATSAVAKGFILNDKVFKENVKELPEEVQAIVLASVLSGRIILNMNLTKILSKASEIEKKLKEMENLTKEDADKLLREDLRKCVIKSKQSQEN